MVDPKMELNKSAAFTHDVIFVDGLWGTGKSMIAPIISGMRGVEKQLMNSLYEELCILRSLSKVTPDAVVAMLQTHANMDQYHNLIGRAVNLRWGDHSGPKNNPNSLRYVRRLFAAEGDQVVDHINRENLALNIMSHMILPVADPLIEAFGQRLRIIEVVRHPAYMVGHWSAYLSRFNSVRISDIAFDAHGTKVPWFAADWADEFIASSPMDRVLLGISRLYERLFRAIEDLNIRSVPLMIVSFESLAMETGVELKRLEEFLGREHHPHIRKLLKKQKLPRRRLTHGTGHRDYGWKPGADKSESDEYARICSSIRASASSENFARFEQSIVQYNQRWPSILSQFRS